MRCLQCVMKWSFPSTEVRRTETLMTLNTKAEHRRDLSTQCGKFSTLYLYIIIFSKIYPFWYGWIDKLWINWAINRVHRKIVFCNIHFLRHLLKFNLVSSQRGMENVFKADFISSHYILCPRCGLSHLQALDGWLNWKLKGN